jgi:hypothetical protein
VVPDEYFKERLVVLDAKMRQTKTSKLNTPSLFLFPTKLSLERELGFWRCAINIEFGQYPSTALGLVDTTALAPFDYTKRHAGT